jgi:hypothetical protein
MTNEQAKTMFAEATVRLMLLSMTEVVDEDGKVVDRFKQEAYAKGLTSEDIALALNRILTENPEPMDARSLERLDPPFGKTLFDNSEYIPIDREHLGGALPTDKNAHKEDGGEPDIKQSHTDSRRLGYTAPCHENSQARQQTKRASNNRIPKKATSVCPSYDNGSMSVL